MPKISLSGNERQDFTITHPQKINISGKVCTGRSAKMAWFGQGGITTDRHPAIATIRNKNTGRNILTQSSPKGTHGCNSLNEKIQVTTWLKRNNRTLLIVKRQLIIAPDDN